MKGLMITDLNNPISCSYNEVARKSFECVSDILDIELYQCRTPATLNPKIKFNPAKKRSETEKAILCTYYDILSRISTQKEELIMMEHDAYLWSDRENDFRNHVRDISRYDIWNVGIAVECHTMSPAMAEQMIDLIDNDFDHRYKGPMGMISCLQNQNSVLFPKNGQEGLITEAVHCKMAGKGEGNVLPAPVTQCYNTALGMTNIRDHYSGHNPLNQPAMFFF